MHRTSGCLLQGKGFVREISPFGELQTTLRLAEPSTVFDYSVKVLSTQPENLQAWLSEAIQPVRSDWDADCAFWKSFWDRSYIQLDIHLVIDNYGTHKTPTVKAWFARHPRFHLHFTPTSGSWLNLVERWFALPRKRQIKRGSHRSTFELEKAIRHYLDVHNQNPTPFVWDKSADEIIESVGPLL